ncbi:MAG: hypothetical protein V2I51_06510, partial [Anderseniella sp.]|nr:hypothetical protein [Anderseniella sp.]
EELDVADTPATGDPDTKWVPYFWPDEVPKGTPAITHNHYFAGAYQDLLPAAGLRYYVYGANSNVIKYNGLHAFNIDETAPDTLGPNKSCPDEALPLTNRLNNVRNKIASLSHWNDGGTVASEGIAWAMRMLSPGAPFTEGARPSKKLEKIIVLFGDGRNQLPVNIDNSPMRTDYSAYGYMFANTGRFEEYDKSALSDFSSLAPVDRLLKASQRVLDQRMRQACDNAKEQNIRILTILFNENDPETKALYQYCASEPEDALVAADPASLKNAFQTIAQKVLKLHLRK